MKVMVGVSGGIAAYKAAELVRALQKQALQVRVTMTDSAQRFIQPLTFAALTGHKVITSLWSQPNEDDAFGSANSDSSIEHIAEAQWADALVVAPATAGILAKFAYGFADDFLTTMYLATAAPVLVAPAMNVNMWEHPATQANLEILRQRGVRVVEPGSGDLACGMVGPGRMAEPEFIATAVLNALGRSHDLAGEVVLITAGGTREALDPVRFLGNRSSGKMGYALAEAAQSRGAKVILVSAPSALYPPAHCELVKVTTADEMRAAVLARMPEATVVIKSAAVADYRPSNIADQKLKRTGPMTIEFLPTEDILAEVVRQRRPGQLIVGFAAETENQVENGRAKLLRKGVDAIVVNDVSREGVGFDSDQNAATFLTATTAIDLPEMSKRKLADRILDEVVALRRPQSLLVELSGMDSTLEAVSESSKVVLEGVDDESFVSDREAAIASRRQIMIE
ncbi:MAG TPA: bifunctional phosphopantothenoylcysteine decarboxylase/phosphopantothenate--cysteine ligase CoaBC [Acidobacteriaceae bacterium]|jgi:phosphopantothenoylcysteine decarboxylase/phosphopantothenate--cysteine ligase|nr:bifunctional phosphopantothenoylcysteine decarboxylase/phosphopantothenate--cysteine ligase CoaBC [Acidobacteriaceae bacterium]